jgi:hypothetical protein
MLVIAYNQALLQSKPKKTQHENWKDIYSEDTLIEEDNERMDIIGQNGNDGLHYDEEIEKPNKKIGKGAITPPGD